MADGGTSGQGVVLPSLDGLGADGRYGHGGYRSPVADRRADRFPRAAPARLCRVPRGRRHGRHVQQSRREALPQLLVRVVQRVRQPPVRQLRVRRRAVVRIAATPAALVASGGFGCFGGVSHHTIVSYFADFVSRIYALVTYFVLPILHLYEFNTSYLCTRVTRLCLHADEFRVYCNRL